MDQLISLCKRRGFIFPGSEIYGGLANAWDFGPLGVALKNNIKRSWWQTFVEERDDMYGLDAALLMNRKVWQASGHESTFSDPLIECKNCHERFREDQLPPEKKCPSCGKQEFTQPQQFNLMLKTFLGPADISYLIANREILSAQKENLIRNKDNFQDQDEYKNKFTEISEKILKLDEFIGNSLVYFRPETAQAMFVDFKQIVDTYSPKLPFGIAQIGKAFRNEITPGNFIFRTREFEQMEIEYFIKPGDDWNSYFEQWLAAMKAWMKKIGIDQNKTHDLEVPKEELAHYSKRTIDIEFDFPFGRKELYGLAYRGDFDLTNHKQEYFNEETKERVVPHVIEPSFGVERSVLAVLASAYQEDEIEGEKRTWLNLPMRIAPYRAAVFPLLSNKPELIEKAQEVRKELQGAWPGFFPIAFDKSGNIGKRYRRQDEIGTPYCFTVDFQTLQDNTITVRDRNTMKQERIVITEARKFLEEKLRE